MPLRYVSWNLDGLGVTDAGDLRCSQGLSRPPLAPFANVSSTGQLALLNDPAGNSTSLFVLGGTELQDDGTLVVPGGSLTDNVFKPVDPDQPATGGVGLYAPAFFWEAFSRQSFKTVFNCVTA
jgi:hypothetical protein